MYEGKSSQTKYWSLLKRIVSMSSSSTSFDPKRPSSMLAKTCLSSGQMYCAGGVLCMRSLSLSTSLTLAPKMNMLSMPISSAISTFAPSMVPMMSPPFMMNFMLLVPEASVPAVEI